MKRIVFIGPPGAGKGTQAQAIRQRFGVPWIATGDMFREAIRAGSEMGRRAQGYVDSGALVPDDVVVGLCLERLAKPDAEDGFLLDGFPRTVAQAQALDAAFDGDAVDVVVHFDVALDTLLERLATRASQQGRKDDAEATVRHRFNVYREQTAPLVSYYTNRGNLVTVDGNGTVSEVSTRILAAIDDLDEKSKLNTLPMQD